MLKTVIFQAIQDTYCGGVLPLYRDAVSVLYSPSWQGKGRMNEKQKAQEWRMKHIKKIGNEKAGKTLKKKRRKGVGTLLKLRKVFFFPSVYLLSL